MSGMERRVVTLADLLARKFPPREDLLGPWLRQGESVMLWAAPGTGKTLLTLTIALAVAGGGTFLGWHSPRPRKVLLVDGEMAAEDLQDRLRMLGATVEGIDMEAAGRNLTLYSRTLQSADAGFPDLGERVGLDGRPSGQDDVMAKARECGAELVLLDNFSTLSEVADENDAASMTPTLAFLLRLKQARIGCVLVHHSGKSGDTYRGSSKLATTFEIIMGLREVAGHDPTEGAAFTLHWEKNRRKRDETTRDREVALSGDGEDLRWSGKAAASDDVRRLVATVRSGQFGTQREIADSLGWAPSKVTTMKGRAVELGAITKAAWGDYMEAGRENRMGGVEEVNMDF